MAKNKAYNVHKEQICVAGESKAKNIDNKEAAVVSKCLEMSNHAFVYMNSGSEMGY